LIERTVRFGSETYDLVVGVNASREIGQRLSSGPYSRFIVIAGAGVPSEGVDGVAFSLGELAPVHIVRFTDTEEKKSLLTVMSLAERAIELEADRRTAIVAVGGGLTGNVAGVVSGLLYRGLPLVHVPTTLMAASDSVLSLKQAVNLSYGKNLVGLYRTPVAVFIDLTILTDLPARHIRAGLCETVKNLLVIQPERIERFRSLLHPSARYTPTEMEEIVDFCVTAKGLVMVGDPYERRTGLALEYGHTIGHALELAEQGRYTHGECVAYGMACAACISNRMGYLSPEDVALHRDLLRLVGVNVTPAAEAVARIERFIQKDNKRGYLPGLADRTGMVLLRRPGELVQENGGSITPVPGPLVMEVVAGDWESFW
jgi:3-dehydroquinate synthase/2-deoxy-scyllo-inosose synthase